MVTVEFHAKIKDGTIHIPAKYRRNLKEKVRVILVSEEERKKTSNFLRELLDSPVKIANFKPLSRDEAYVR